jgi:hypothetical protein
LTGKHERINLPIGTCTKKVLKTKQHKLHHHEEGFAKLSSLFCGGPLSAKNSSLQEIILPAPRLAVRANILKVILRESG